MLQLLSISFCNANCIAAAKSFSIHTLAITMVSETTPFLKPKKCQYTMDENYAC